MKEAIHPNYHEATVVCACGATFTTGTTKDTKVIKVEICNKCHPYFTGKQVLRYATYLSTGKTSGDRTVRVDKFKKKYPCNNMSKSKRDIQMWISLFFTHHKRYG